MSEPQNEPEKVWTPEEMTPEADALFQLVDEFKEFNKTFKDLVEGLGEALATVQQQQTPT